jgi:argininosuccinate lyase
LGKGGIQQINKSVSLWKRQGTGLGSAKYDALGSIAHAKMLGNIGLLTANETDMLVAALNEIILMLLLEISQLKIPLKMYIRK